MHQHKKIEAIVRMLITHLKFLHQECRDVLSPPQAAAREINTWLKYHCVDIVYVEISAQ